jgi:RimJ/RimL family protein N-acetyltransferase
MLQGERVILRAMERSDLPRWHELMNREVALVSLGYSPWQPLPLAALEQSFEKQLEADERSWFVIEIENKVVGHIGLKSWSWDRRTGSAEFGLSIYDPEYLGQGYGREALNLLLDWAFRIQNWRRIWCDTLGTNERAIRSYRACGFVEEGRLRQHDYHDGGYVDVVILGLLRTEWEARQPSLQRNG